MSKADFAVTFERITDESAEIGDIAESGFVLWRATLRECIAEFFDSYDGTAPIEADSSPCDRPRWFSYGNGRDLESGDFFGYALHLPERLTPATRRRIARLIGVYGFEQKKPGR